MMYRGTILVFACVLTAVPAGAQGSVTNFRWIDSACKQEQLTVSCGTDVKSAQHSSVLLASPQPPPTSEYVLIGAAIGAGVGGLAAWYQLSRCDACFLGGPFVVLSIGAGALVGAAAGFIVHVIKFPEVP